MDLTGSFLEIVWNTADTSSKHVGNACESNRKTHCKHVSSMSHGDRKTLRRHYGNIYGNNSNTTKTHRQGETVNKQYQTDGVQPSEK